MATPDFESDEYKAYKNQLIKVNDIYKGTDTAVKYLRKFEKEADFEIRQQDANLDNYVFRTVDTIKNIVFRKPIDITNITNTLVMEWAEKINHKDNLNEFSKKILTSRVRDGFTFILVDSVAYNSEEIITKADQEKAGIRPYFVNILRSQVKNWQVDEYGQFSVFSIFETYEEKTDRFKTEVKEQIRVYELTKGKVQVSIWREGAEVSEFTQILNIPIIPVVQVGRDMIPPLYDQAKINIAHLNRNSEKANYVRVGACPFPIIKGQLENDTSTPQTLSINQGLHFTDENGSFSWAETSGSNYAMIQEEIKYLEEQMERTSVEFATQIKNTTATEVEKASTSNESKLTDYATEIEQGINTALELLEWYKTNGSLGDNTITVNKDFDSNILTNEQANFLLNLRTQGVLSYDLLMDMLIQGELIPYLTKKERETEKLLLRDELGTIE